VTLLARGAGRLLAIGGWAPIAVFSLHLILVFAFDLYAGWPDADVPMHFAGGLAMAYFVSGCFRALTAGLAGRGRLVLLELVLALSLTATAAVAWEFTEFALDHLAGTNLQYSLANTMQDLALGMLGSIVFLVVRARQLRVGAAELRDVAGGWLSGCAACRHPAFPPDPARTDHEIGYREPTGV
jgi:uncharacterized membrane protein